MPPSLARVDEPRRPPFRIGLVQQRWHADPDEHRAALAEGVALAAGEGAQLVCLQELTLSPYFADHPRRPGGGRRRARAAARTARRTRSPPSWRAETGVARPRLALRARRRRRTASASTPRSASAPDGELVARTRKLHIPVTAGYYEDRYFRPGPTTRLSRSSRVGDAQLRLPDLLGPVVPRAGPGLLARRAPRCIVYPTAIGSEPDHPDFDTQPLWQQVIVGNGIANGTFMVAVNRIGDRGRRSRSTARRSSPTPTAASSCRRRATSPPCSSPTSTSTSAATGWRSSRSSDAPPRHLRRAAGLGQARLAASVTDRRRRRRSARSRADGVKRKRTGVRSECDSVRMLADQRHRRPSGCHELPPTSPGSTGSHARQAEAHLDLDLDDERRQRPSCALLRWRTGAGWARRGRRR